jgi:hypothetical protein
MNDELRRLYEEEREDTRGYEGAESFLTAQARRALLQRRLHQQPEYLSQAQDFYHAAFLMQHGEELEHWWKAHELARKGAELGEHKARYLVAASLDRYLMRQGQPQKYGTNGIWDEKLGRWRVWDYDPTTTDQERAQWAVPPLAELLSRLEAMNQPSDASEKWKKAFAVKTVAGYEILLTNLKGESSYWGEEVPPYLPLENLASKLPGPLPTGLSFWQFKGVYCARRADGELFLTWQPCRWGPVGEDSQKPEIYARLSGNIHWLDREKNYWQRGLRLVSPETGWLVGAALPRPSLAELVLSLGEEPL